MKKIDTHEHKEINRPKVLSHQAIRFETAQSWNKGHGNLNHPGTGNGGIHYPNDPYTGPRPPGNDNANGGNGNGNGKKNGH